MIADATAHTEEVAKRLRWERLRREREAWLAKEQANANLQARIDALYQAQLNSQQEMNAYTYNTGFMEPRHRSSCHRGYGED